MSALFLDDIVAHHRARAATDSRQWTDRGFGCPGPSLRKALIAHRRHGLAVIAEIKRKSPSRGWLNEHLDPAALAGAYVAGGASAISVLTDEEFFGGSISDVRAVRACTDIPVLRKDFTVAANDIVDASEAGASAVLLIVAALSNDELTSLLTAARTVQLDALVEVHDETEAQRALDAGADLIGVNQRDLRTFDVDPARAELIAAHLPSSVVTVAESGFRDAASVRRAAAAGFDAVLVGEQFVTAPDVRAAVEEFVGAPIGPRA